MRSACFIFNWPSCGGGEEGRLLPGLYRERNQSMALQAFVWAPIQFPPLCKGRQGGVEASRGWASREGVGSCERAGFLPPLAPPYKGGGSLGAPPYQGGGSLRNHPRPSKHPHDFRKNHKGFEFANEGKFTFLVFGSARTVQARGFLSLIDQASPGCLADR